MQIEKRRIKRLINPYMFPMPRKCVDGSKKEGGICVGSKGGGL